MLIVYMLSLTLVFAAATLFAWNFIPRRGGTLAVRGIAAQRADLSKLPSTLFRLSFPLLDLLAPVFRLIQWKSYRQKATIALQKAGIADVITVDHLLAMKAISAVITPFVVSTLFEVFQNPALFVGAGVGGFMLPDRFVADLRKQREKQILRTLPGAVDVLSLSVEAG